MEILENINQDNLCTYFVLPLLKLSKFSFINSNFVNTYLTKEGSQIVVQVYDITLLSRAVYIHPNFKGVYTKEGFYYVMYDIPRHWKTAVEFFLKGKYSRMSNIAHNMIRIYSGLPYKEKGTDMKVRTDGRLLALTRDPVLKKMWVDTLGLQIDALDDDDELLPNITDKSFIDLKDLIKYP